MVCQLLPALQKGVFPQGCGACEQLALPYISTASNRSLGPAETPCAPTLQTLRAHGCHPEQAHLLPVRLRRVPSSLPPSQADPELERPGPGWEMWNSLPGVQALVIASMTQLHSEVYSWLNVTCQQAHSESRVIKTQTLSQIFSWVLMIQKDLF